MENEKNDSVASFLNEFGPEKDLFKEEANTEEPVVEEEAEEEDKPLPFHKDPKVQRYVEKQIEKALKDIPKSAEGNFKKDVEDINLPASFVKLVGNDTPEKMEVLKDLSNYFGTLKGEARQEFLEEMKQQEEEAKQADDAAVEELSLGFERIEEEYGVDLDSDLKTRSAFVEFLRKVSPKNGEGEVAQFADIPSTWETFQDLNKRPPTQSRAKQLASRGLARSSDAQVKSPIGSSWKDVDKFFDQLKSQN